MYFSTLISGLPYVGALISGLPYVHRYVWSVGVPRPPPGGGPDPTCSAMHAGCGGIGGTVSGRRQPSFRRSLPSFQGREFAQRELKLRRTPPPRSGSVSRRSFLRILRSFPRIRRSFPCVLSRFPSFRRSFASFRGSFPRVSCRFLSFQCGILSFRRRGCT